MSNNPIQVRLIGYCIEGSLFVVYEYIENGNLSEHLHGSCKITVSLLISFEGILTINFKQL